MKRIRRTPEFIRRILAVDDDAPLDLSRFPHVAAHEHGAAFVADVALYGSPKTVYAYGRDLDDYFAFCEAEGVRPESREVNRGHLSRYVRYLRLLPSRRGPNVVRFDSAVGLADATLQRRVTVVRLFYDFLIGREVRTFNPVPRGRRHAFGRVESGSGRALLRPPKQYPWIPDEREWARFATAVREAGTDCDLLMLSLEYAEALRISELCALRVEDLDLDNGCVFVRKGKGARPRTVPLLPRLLPLLARYLRRRGEITTSGGALFVSESNRNLGRGVTTSTWTKRIEHFRELAALPRMKSHTMRHLCLTDLARQGWDIERIALFAGHSSIESTRIYVHLAASDLVAHYAKGLADLQGHRTRALTRTLEREGADA